MKTFRRAAIAGVAVLTTLLGGLTGISPANATDTPGIDWTSRTSAADSDWKSVAYGNGVFVAVAVSGASRIMRSTDGITWTAQTAPVENNWQGVTYGNGIFLAVASGGMDYDHLVMTSTDGITWTAQTTPNSEQWFAVTFGNGMFVATGVPTYDNQRVMTSVDGTNWQLQVTPGDGAWRSVTYGNGLFVATSSLQTGNDVITSTDGSNWTLQATPTFNPWKSVTYGNGTFVAIADGGSGDRVMTSTDGVTWTAQNSAADKMWTSVAYGSGLFVAVAVDAGANGVMTSPDGITWTSRASAANKFWMGVGYGGGMFVAVASYESGNLVMTSGSTGSAPTMASASITGTLAAGQTLTATANGLTGSPAPTLTYRWESSPDGSTWSTIPSAVSDQYRVAAAFAGQRIRVIITATNSTAPAVSRTSAAVTIMEPPTITSVAVTGTVAAGENVTATVTGLAGTPTPTLSYVWQSSVDKGAWTAISGATSRRYRVPASLEGQRIRVVVSATNGAMPNASKASPAVKVLYSPTITSVTIDGTNVVGQTLTATPKGVDGDPDPTFSYVWQASVGNGPWTVIDGATSEDYTVESDYNGARVRAVVTASNGIDPDGSKASPAFAIKKSELPTEATDISESVVNRKITLTWKAGTSDPDLPITGYAITCSLGDARVRDSVPGTARKVTLTVTDPGQWVCRVATITALGRSETTPIRVGVK